MDQLRTPSELASHLEVGIVRLCVQNLDQMQLFYENIVGLDVIEKSATHLILGYQQQPLLHLLHTPGLAPAPTHSAGLYHLAIVFAERATLAKSLHRILTQTPELFSGSSNHLVSEAFYFTDPEGNGVELYFDKDPSTWEWQNGRVVMGSLYIDPENYIETYVSTPNVSTAKKIGHVHLKVGSIDTARNFYVEIVGLAITAEMPAALFLSDGTYHHHLGLNVWESQGAGQREQTLGLHEFQLHLPLQSDLEKLTSRLKENAISFASHKAELRLSDPWGNQLSITVK